MTCLQPQAVNTAKDDKTCPVCPVHSVYYIMKENLFLIPAGNKVVLWTQETEALVTFTLSSVTADTIIIPVRT